MTKMVTCPRCRRVVDAGTFCGICAAPLRTNTSVTRILVIIAAALGGFVFLFVVASLMEIKKASPNNANKAIQEYVAREDAAKTAPELTPAGRLAHAKEIIRPAASSDELGIAKMHLQKIPTDAPEYKTAKQLIGQLDGKIKATATSEAVATQKKLEAEYGDPVALRKELESDYRKLSRPPILI